MININLKYERKNRDYFIAKFLEILNLNSIIYIFYKGLSYEYIIYNNIPTRIYSDIDIIIKREEIFKTLEIIKKSFDVLSVENINDYNYNEYKLKVSFNEKKYLVELKSQHFEIDNSYVEYALNSRKAYDFKEYFFYSYDYENMFISMCLYIYNYNFRLNPWLFSNKMKFSYFVDLKKFINTYKINYEKVFDIAGKYKVIFKIIRVIHNAYIIFLSDDFKDLYNSYEQLVEKCPCSDRTIANNISLINKIFNKEEVSYLIKKYLTGNFLLDKNNKFDELFNPKEIIIDGVNVIEFKSYLKNKKWIFSIRNCILPKNGEYVIYVMLYHYTNDDEFNYPYNPISVRLCEDDYKVFNRFTIDFEKRKYLYEKEYYMSYQKSGSIVVNRYNDNNFDLEIDLNKNNIRMIFNDKIAYNIAIIKIEIEDKINVIWRMSNQSDEPYVLTT